MRGTFPAAQTWFRRFGGAVGCDEFDSRRAPVSPIIPMRPAPRPKSKTPADFKVGQMTIDDFDFLIEDVSPQEVDRIVADLKTLQRSVASVTIRESLDECATNIHFLAHDDEGGLISAA